VSDSASIDLSGATRLKDAAFRYESHNIDWITSALRTITSEHQDFQQITIYIPRLRLWTLFTIDADGEATFGEPFRGQWLDLDRLLVQFWESRSIRPRICPRLEEECRDAEICLKFLLPEITKRGVFDLFESIPPE